MFLCSLVKQFRKRKKIRNIPSPMIELIKKFEGLRLKAYLDPAGVLTIGYGHTGSDVYADMYITLQQAYDLLMQDASKSLDSLFADSPTVESAGENRISAIGDFVFNLGIGNYNKSTFKKCVDAQDWMNASQECKRWVHVGGKQLKGLVERRESEAELLLKG